MLHLTTGDLRIARQVIDVELDRAGTGVLHRQRVARPAAGGDAVQARDHRDVDGLHRPLEQAQVAPRPRVLLGGRR